MYKRTQSLLYEYPNINIEIENIDIEITALKNDLGDLDNISYEQKVCTSKNNNSIVERRVIKKEEREQELLQLKKYKQYQKLKMENALGILSDDEMNLIKLRYFNKLTFIQMAIRMGYTESHICNLCKKAVQKIEQIYFASERALKEKMTF